MSFSSSATSLGGGWPSCFASIGLGSSRSTWLGPPCMKSWMTAFARAGMCGGRGRTSKSRASGGGFVRLRGDSPRSAARTIPPKPPPRRDNASRRVGPWGIGSCDRVGIGRPRFGSIRSCQST